MEGIVRPDVGITAFFVDTDAIDFAFLVLRLDVEVIFIAPGVVIVLHEHRDLGGGIGAELPVEQEVRTIIIKNFGVAQRDGPVESVDGGAVFIQGQGHPGTFWPDGGLRKGLGLQAQDGVQAAGGAPDQLRSEQGVQAHAVNGVKAPDHRLRAALGGMQRQEGIIVNRITA